MTTTETRIANTTKKIEKEEKKLERIKVALAGGKNPYYYDESSLRECENELRHLNEKLEGYKAKKQAEDDEKNNRVPIIEEFLDKWEEGAIKYHEDEYEKLKEFKQEYREKTEKFKEELREQGIYYSYGKPEIVAMEEERGIDHETYLKTIKHKFSMTIIECSEYGKSWRDRLIKLVAREKDTKRKMLMTRVTEIVGTITNAKMLYIADNGEINGFIIGTDGKAEVRTIWAGGYNIQCLHFRVLVRDLA